MVEGHFPANPMISASGNGFRFIPVAAASPPVSDRRLAMEDLFSETLLLREPGSGTREILARYLESCNYDVSHFSKVLEITNMHSIQVLAEEDCGITFLYEAVAEEALQKGTLIRIPLQDFELSHNISFIWRRNSIFAEEYQNFFGNSPDFSMAAVFSAPSLMAAAALPMALAAVMAAVSAVIVVIAGSLRILNQGAGQQGIHRPVRVSADSGVQADARLLKGFSGAAADTAADQDISPISLSIPARAPWPCPLVLCTAEFTIFPSSAS